ncbi:MAG: acyl-CoA dehydrogenase [SAR202 cluster bacterium]|nr:acyl-CoA dehydrogenase [SAR202 cluster bacterium]
MYFTDEHELFRKTVRRFVQEELTPNVARWEEDGLVPRQVFRRMGEMGFLGVEYPVEYGGSEADFWITVVLAEELARCGAGGVAFSIVVHTDMSSPWLARVGTPEQKARFLPAITSGEKVCALAITEPGAGSDMASLATTARRDGDHWVINGSKTFITNGVYGDLYFVAARSRDTGRKHQQLSQIIVERGASGLTVSKKLDKTGMRSSDTAELHFDNVRVPAANLLGEEGRGFYQLAAGLQRERLLSAVLSISAARKAVEDTVAYLKQRQAFGQPLAEFQALRHRMADAATLVEASRQVTYSAAAKYAAGHECSMEVSMAKLFSTEAANRVAYETVQMHGGMGYMRETPIERFARDYRLWTIAAGSSEMMREIIAKKMFS